MAIETFLSRTAMLIGEDKLKKLASSRIAVFGIGGVGGYVTEALVRSGVGALDLIDADRVNESNLNRQIIATRATIGQYKTEAAKDRAKLINPECEIGTYNFFYLPETAETIDFSRYDYVIDAVDTVTAKIEIIMRSQAAGVPVISSMGTGNKLRPAMLEVADIYNTSVCPLARIMRHELKKRGVKKLKVVYSKETPSGERGTVPGSISFVPGTAGLILAGEAVNDILCLKS
jgi:tRNA A37 threonylcarbamoyladenosine dehydratase